MIGGCDDMGNVDGAVIPREGRRAPLLPSLQSSSLSHVLLLFVIVALLLFLCEGGGGGDLEELSLMSPLVTHPPNVGIFENPPVPVISAAVLRSPDRNPSRGRIVGAPYCPGNVVWRCTTTIL